MATSEHSAARLYAEPPEVHDRNLRIGVRLLAGSTIMFFFAFAFAYFYLRSVDSHGRWNEHGAAAPDGYGIAIVALFVLGGLAITMAARAARRNRPWLAPTGLAVGAVIVAIVLQAFEYAHVDFTPGEGGYTSVFYGWTALLAVFALGALYWIAVLFAEGLRIRTAESQPARPGLDEAALNLCVIALIAVIAWVLLYLL